MSAMCLLIPANLEKSFDQITSRCGTKMWPRRARFRLCWAATTRSDFTSVRARHCAVHIEADRHHPFRPPYRHPGEGPGRAHAHHAVVHWATNLPNVPATNLVQHGIGGWQVPRAGVQAGAAAQHERADHRGYRAARAGEDGGDRAGAGVEGRRHAVYISFDVDSVDCGFVPGTGWPEPGGFLPREALKLLGLVAAQGVCGLEVVEVSPPYDTSDITALLEIARCGRGAGCDGGARHSGQAQADHRPTRDVLRQRSCMTGRMIIHIIIRMGIRIRKPGRVATSSRAAAQWQTPHLPQGTCPRRNYTGRARSGSGRSELCGGFHALLRCDELPAVGRDSVRTCCCRWAPAASARSRDRGPDGCWLGGAAAGWRRDALRSLPEKLVSRRRYLADSYITTARSWCGWDLRRREHWLPCSWHFSVSG